MRLGFFFRRGCLMYEVSELFSFNYWGYDGRDFYLN